MPGASQRCERRLQSSRHAARPRGASEGARGPLHRKEPGRCSAATTGSKRSSPVYTGRKRRGPLTTPGEEVRRFLRIRGRPDHVGRRTVPDMPEPPRWYGRCRQGRWRARPCDRVHDRLWFPWPPTHPYLLPAAGRSGSRRSARG
jgi:hypothetical protein